jgi:hypothetical protein
VEGREYIPGIVIDPEIAESIAQGSWETPGGEHLPRITHLHLICAIACSQVSFASSDLSVIFLVRFSSCLSKLARSAKGVWGVGHGWVDREKNLSNPSVDLLHIGIV